LERRVKETPISQSKFPDVNRIGPRYFILRQAVINFKLPQRFKVASSVSKRPLLISKAWPQAVILVFLFGFFIMGILCYRSYTAGPPIPGSVVSPTGEMLFTGADIQEGQKIFLRNGLMEYGSIFGHGAYLGPDYTADYLRRSANIVEESYRGLGDSVAKSKTADDFKTNQFDPSRNELQLTAGQATAFHQLVSYYGNYFSSLTADKGLRPGAIVDPTELKQLTAFFNWSAWVSSTKRPGQEYSYTNNWPPEPRVGNEPTGPMIVWSVLSLITLLGGIGLLLAAFGRWNFLGWHGQHERVVSFRAPDTVPLTPAQRVCAWFYFVMALLFFIQAMLGGATQHYRADIANFFGINLAQLLPYNLARTWHLQLSIFWVSVSFLAAGIFIVPLISRHEPKGQQWLAYGLLGALAVVVAGSMFG
jgi:nitric oxide reductase subunit B